MRFPGASTPPNAPNHKPPSFPLFRTGALAAPQPDFRKIARAQNRKTPHPPISRARVHEVNSYYSLYILLQLGELFHVVYSSIFLIHYFLDFLRPPNPRNLLWEPLDTRDFKDFAEGEGAPASSPSPSTALFKHRASGPAARRRSRSPTPIPARDQSPSRPPKSRFSRGNKQNHGFGP